MKAKTFEDSRPRLADGYKPQGNNYYRRIKLTFYSCFVSMCICTLEEGIGFYGATVTDSYEPPSRCWKLNLAFDRIAKYS